MSSVHDINTLSQPDLSECDFWKKSLSLQKLNHNIKTSIIKNILKDSLLIDATKKSITSRLSNYYSSYDEKKISFTDCQIDRMAKFILIGKSLITNKDFEKLDTDEISFPKNRTGLCAKINFTQNLSPNSNDISFNIELEKGIPGTFKIPTDCLYFPSDVEIIKLKCPIKISQNIIGKTEKKIAKIQGLLLEKSDEEYSNKEKIKRLESKLSKYKRINKSPRDILIYSEIIIHNDLVEKNYPFVVPLKNITESRDLEGNPDSLEINIYMQRCRTDAANFLKSRTLTKAEKKHFCLQLLNATQLLHEHGYVHRDLKPENILINLRDHLFDLYLTDFGTAKVIGTEASFYDLGSLCYLAPEGFLVRRKYIYDEKVDAWAVGVILMELYYEENPFANAVEETLPDPDLNSPRKLFECMIEITKDYYTGNNPKTLKEIFQKMLAFSPKSRWSCKEAYEFLSKQPENSSIFEIEV